MGTYNGIKTKVYIFEFDVSFLSFQEVTLTAERSKELALSACCFSKSRFE